MVPMTHKELRELADHLYPKMTQAEKEVYELSMDWGFDDTCEVIKKIKERIDKESDKYDV